MRSRLTLVLFLSSVAVLVAACNSTPPAISPTTLPSSSTSSPPPPHFSITPIGEHIFTPIPESTLDLRPPSIETVTPSPTSTSILGRVERVTSGSYVGWNRYTHPKYGFAFYFPPDWKVSLEDAHFVGIVSSAEPGFEFHVGFKSIHEADVTITRTGVGEGEILDQGHVHFLGKVIPRKVLVAQGEVTTVLYNWACETRVGDMVFTLSLDYLDIKRRTIPVEIQAIADRIVESFEWINP